MTTDPRERLRRIDPAPVDAEPPSGAIEAVAVIHEIERRMGMEQRETTDQPTITNSQQQQEAAPPTSAPDQVPTTPLQRTSPGRRRALLVGVGAVAAALFIGAAALGIVAVVDDDGTTDVAGGGADPATVLADYVEARNSGDVDAVMALYAEDAVLKDHPLHPNTTSVVTGTDEIRALEEQIPAVQGSGDGIELVDMEVSSDTVLFSSRFFYGADGTHSGGTAGCSGTVRNSVTVEDGKITLYDFGSESPTLCR